jgi:hypothetical protein
LRGADDSRAAAGTALAALRQPQTAADEGVTMRTVLATLSATLLVAALLGGCDKRGDTTGAAPAMPPGSAASR